MSRAEKYECRRETIEFVLPFRSLLTVVPLTVQSNEEGMQLASRYQLSVNDGMIVAAALEANCSVLFSEDMHAGLLIERRLAVQNPFENQL